jgi:hypothetical protein
MAVSLLETNVEELARFLKSKKNQGQRIRLLLGSRIGSLYDGRLYDALSVALKSHAVNIQELLKQLRHDTSIARELSMWTRSIQVLANLTPTIRFGECYNFLDKHFSENSIHNIFNTALASGLLRKEDELMAGFIKAELFNTIFTTNFDTSLEDACALQGLIKSVDYDLFSCGTDDIMTTGQSSNRYGKIIKIFGDFPSLEYKAAGRKFDLDTNQSLKKFLMSELARDIIVLGYDPIWDKPIEQAFQEIGGMLWYVNEEQPQADTYMARVLDQRYSKFIGIAGWNYTSFLQTLSNLVGGKASTQPVTPSSDPARRKVFISYSHNDQEHLKRLRIHLKGNRHTGNEIDTLILKDDIWDDTKIPLGADWEKVIREALAQAKVAVLLVSADFFGSDFIREKELPVLLEAAEAGKMEICPVILSDSVYERTKLSTYQAINPVTKPLIGMSVSERETVWAKLEKQIFTILTS